jgi:hypothetical protein
MYTTDNETDTYYLSLVAYLQKPAQNPVQNSERSYAVKSLEEKSLEEKIQELENLLALYSEKIAGKTKIVDKIKQDAVSNSISSKRYTVDESNTYRSGRISDIFTSFGTIKRVDY